MTATSSAPSGAMKISGNLDIYSVNELRNSLAEHLANSAEVALSIKMPESKIPMLQSRLMRRMRDLQIASISQYCEYLFNSKNAQDEISHFINAVTTNKTDFFREPQHFDYLVRQVSPRHSAHWAGGQSARFTVWCAG